MIEKPIYVTQPSIPSLDEFNEYLKKIWENKILTNNGEFHQQLEDELCKYLQVKHISLFSNGTLALITALQALKITGEVITTPFSFVATSHSLWWNGVKPIFVDIEETNYNLDPAKIEAAITPQTTAILPVHVYGNPCNVKEIKRIADRYGLKVIYDACHAFGVKKDGDSILNCGDLSILSFHATKVFNTFEGGAIISPNKETKNRIDFLKNFGIADELTVVGPGINAKMNELQSAFGLIQLKHLDNAIEKRKVIAGVYRTRLRDLKGITVLSDIPSTKHNYSYFPILIDKDRYGMSRDEVYDQLKNFNVYTRKYFYPLISEFSTYKGLPSSTQENLPVANKISKQILCLPIYPDLDLGHVNIIADLLLNKMSPQRAK